MKEDCVRQQLFPSEPLERTDEGSISATERRLNGRTDLFLVSARQSCVKRWIHWMKYASRSCGLSLRQEQWAIGGQTFQLSVATAGSRSNWMRGKWYAERFSVAPFLRSTENRPMRPYQRLMATQTSSICIAKLLLAKISPNETKGTNQSILLRQTWHPKIDTGPSCSLAFDTLRVRLALERKWFITWSQRREETVVMCQPIQKSLPADRRKRGNHTPFS